MNQNYLSKRPLDSISGSKFHGMNQNYLSKRPLDSISSGFNGMRQNFLSKKSFDSISGSGLHGMGQNFLDGKRTFDSIGGGDLQGMGQNFLTSKRGFDPISTGSLHGMRQNFFGHKRSFDSISRNRLGNLRQNFLSKRADESADEWSVNDASPEKRFDSISTSALNGMGQNFFDKKYFDNFPEGAVSKRFDPISSSGTISGLQQNFLKKKDSDSRSAGGMGGVRLSFPRQTGSVDGMTSSKRQFDSISGGSGIGGLGQNFLNRRQFDSINEGDIGGMEQNFLSGKRFDTISSGKMAGFNQNFLGKRQFDSISTGEMSGMDQNFLGKRGFDSINSDSRISGMGQKYLVRRSSSLEPLPSAEVSEQPHDVYKRSPEDVTSLEASHDSAVVTGDTSEPIGPEHRFIKRSFDSISRFSGGMAGMSQNYLSRRASNTRALDSNSQPSSSSASYTSRGTNDVTSLAGVDNDHELWRILDKKNLDSISRLGAYFRLSSELLRLAVCQTRGPGRARLQPTSPRHRSSLQSMGLPKIGVRRFLRD
ncbi:pedal peptide 4 [Aplysia californica]|uniref:Pedal peptide 4 n=1 Tax=Aplysia californica TaxID=6500 RepID=A1XP51_APLCA|nr:pedal peptide 4 [Aplysia californica]ABF18975.1 pedal peptide 4 [Aplysia californica]